MLKMGQLHSLEHPKRWISLEKMEMTLGLDANHHWIFKFLFLLCCQFGTALMLWVLVPGVAKRIFFDISKDNPSRGFELPTLEDLYRYINRPSSNPCTEPQPAHLLDDDCSKQGTLSAPAIGFPGRESFREQHPEKDMQLDQPQSSVPQQMTDVPQPPLVVVQQGILQFV